MSLMQYSSAEQIAGIYNAAAAEGDNTASERIYFLHHLNDRIKSRQEVGNHFCEAALLIGQRIYEKGISADAPEQQADELMRAAIVIGSTIERKPVDQVKNGRQILTSIQSAGNEILAALPEDDGHADHVKTARNWVVSTQYLIDTHLAAPAPTPVEALVKLSEALRASCG